MCNISHVKDIDADEMLILRRIQVILDNFQIDIQIQYQHSIEILRSSKIQNKT